MAARINELLTEVLEELLAVKKKLREARILTEEHNRRMEAKTH